MSYHCCWFPFPQLVKNPPAMRETWVQSLGSIPGLGRSPGKGKGYPLQHSDLENSMDYTVHGVAELDTTDFHFHFHHCCNKWLWTQWHDTNSLLYSSRSQKSKVGLSRLTLRCQQNCLPSGGSRGESVSLPFQPQKLPSSPDLWSTANNHTTLTSAHAITSSLALFLPFTLRRTFVIILGPSR